MGVFGPSQSDILKELAEASNGEYFEKRFSRHLEVNNEGHITYVDFFAQSTGQSVIYYTRVQLPYFIGKEIDIKVYKHGFFSDIGKALGMQDIEIGNVEFDDDFVVKSKNETAARDLLADNSILDYIMRHPKWTFSVKDRAPVGGRKLSEKEQVICFYATGIIKEVDVIKEMVDATHKVLERMIEQGYALEEPSDAVLFKK